MPREPMNIVLTICTRQRREPRRDCLASITADPVPDGIAFAVVVVENHATRDCAAMVEEIGAGTPFALHYVHEPRLGIPIVRIHKTLRMSPAMAAGVSDTLRDVEWIVGLIDARAPKPKRPATYKKEISN